MRTTHSSILSGLGLYAASMPAALAHTFGAPGAGWAEGFAHPFSGLDHLLAMLAVGLWAAQLGGRARWLVPSAFVAVMVVAGCLAAAGMGLPLLEAGIAASVLMLGLLVMFRVRLATTASVALVGLLAVFHGFAHGLELPATANPALYGVGFAMATALLHGVGLGLGLSLRGQLLRLGGSAIALAGLCLLASA